MKILGIGVQAGVEALTESATGVTQLAADEMFFDDEIEAAQYWRTAIHSGVVGGLMGGGITAGTIGTQVALTGDRKKIAMSNHITVAEFRKNYDQYMKRMEEGETFVITDVEENKADLYRPLEDNRGIPIDIEQAKF